jgi:hypothetical protein
MLQRSLSGEFHVEVLGPDTWWVTNQRPPGQCLLLRRVEASDPLQAPGVAQRISVTWNGSAPVAVAFTRDEQTMTVVAGAVFLNEPAAAVYAGLPLPAFTSTMRRFWRRVFRLVRIPGGRWALGWLSRRRRGRGT